MEDIVVLNDKVKCEICGKELVRINWLHVRTHNMSVDDYVKLFPTASITSEIFKERCKIALKPQLDKLHKERIGMKFLWSDERRENHKKVMKEAGIRKIGKKMKMSLEGSEAHRLAAFHMKEMNKGRKQSKEHIENRVIHYKGKTYEEMMGVEKAAKLREVRKHAFDNMTPEIHAKFVASAANATRMAAHKMHTDKEHRQRYCQMRKNIWANVPKEKRDEWVANSRKAVCARPNKPETYVQSVLDFLYPKEWKYVGNGEVIINGFNPDFININGQKKIIEVFGTYYHSKEVLGRDNKEEEKRKSDRYSEYGYSTLVIWEHELKSPRKIVSKITKFAEELT